MVIWELADLSTPERRLSLESSTALFGSYLLLSGSFALRLLAWRVALHGTNHRTSWAVTIESRFRPILAKYAPGKIWAVVSTAGVLNRHGIPQGKAFAITTWFQVVQILSGFAVGALGVSLLGTQTLNIMIPDTVLFILGVIICGLFFGVEPLISAIWKLTGRTDRALRIGWRAAAFTFAISVAAWLFMGMAYWQFCRALGVDVAWYFIALLPLANVTGMLSFITPGGIGVRESAITMFLVGAGAGMSNAGAIAFLSRIWSVAAECAACAIGTLAGRQHG